jgi:hypothetical protein
MPPIGRRRNTNIGERGALHDYQERDQSSDSPVAGLDSYSTLGNAWKQFSGKRVIRYLDMYQVY